MSENTEQRAVRARRVAARSEIFSEPYCDGVYDGYCKGARSMIDVSRRALYRTLRQNEVTAAFTMAQKKSIINMFTTAVKADFKR